MSTDLEALTQDSASRYMAAAQEALSHYTLGPSHLHFIAHNAGVVYRVDIAEQAQRYLLKLHDRVGEGDNAPVTGLEMGMQWLAGIARDTAVMVQTPIASSAGPFVSTVLFEGKAIPCTLQQWLEGRLPNGPFSAEQMHQIGKMMATLHRYSHLNDFPVHSATEHGVEALQQGVLLLRNSLDRTILPDSAYAIIGKAASKIQAILERLGKSRDVWGPVHGDIHYDNVLLVKGDVYPIDFSELRLAHYLYDIGLTLYHTLHQGAALRQRFLQGYQQVEPLYRQHLQYLEAFVTFAALLNIAWNATIPGQDEAPLFRKNLDQLVFEFCQHVADERSFL